MMAVASLTMMAATVLLLLLTTTSIVVSAFQPIQLHMSRCQHQRHHRQQQHRHTTSLFSSNNNWDKLQEFEYLLQETAAATTESSSSNFKRRIELPGDDQKVLMVSSSTFAGGAGGGATDAIQQESTSSNEYIDDQMMMDDDNDPYADLEQSRTSPSQQRLVQQQPTMSSQRTSLNDRLKTMDLQDVITTLIIPTILLGAGIRWTYGKVSNRLIESKSNVLKAFVKEMIYHDGDPTEMKLCLEDYRKKPALLLLGVHKNKILLQQYLAQYAKKRTVSPQSISSISYIFSLFGLSETQAADTLVEISQDLGQKGTSTAGKLYFYGNRILQDPSAKARLRPIEDMLKAAYRDAAFASSVVETSQKAMGEAAYRTAVQAGGDSQTSLTPGWEILGLDKETATKIFQTESDNDFVSDMDVYYGRETREETEKMVQEYQEKKNEEIESNGESNVYECGNCGYTMFIAKGRETKFFGDDFKCPECGAGKDQFSQRDDLEEEE